MTPTIPPLDAATSAPCDPCGTELPLSVPDAAEPIYGPPSGTGADVCYRPAGAPGSHTGSDPELDECAGSLPVLDAPGPPGPSALVAAFRHVGAFGECRP
jgi:hypothetical protein